ncbi:putative Histidine kinase [Nitrospira sp. KM1]|uniref:PAS domain S-box protein n=1 Tax=Nitrospira sp. KM1 TaxID=1936990 RepID=UPI0013A7590F|nr:PAS domain S-box protein [Nitrospira sp. KM1]BCA54347.1 putative Histidine kinase [Nitrospira sp. KM1]
MTFWSRSHSLQRKIITAIVMVGLLPLTLLLALTYVEERRALRETTGTNFKEVAVEAARRIEMHITRGMNEAQQLATTPFLRTAVTEANRAYEGKDPRSIQDTIKDWQQRWKQRDKRSEFPLFINRIVTNYLIRWHDIRKSDYVGILITDNQGALVVSSIPQVEYFYGKSSWWQAVVRGGTHQPYVSDISFDPSFGTHVVVVAAPIVGDTPNAVIGAVAILLRRDTLFHSIAEVAIGSTGHAMLFTSDGTPVICPILAPEEHSVKPPLIETLAALKSGWAVTDDDSHGSKDALIGFAPVRFTERLAPGSIGGKHWITVVRQDPHETFAPLAELVAKVLLYGLAVLAVLWSTGLIVARRIARPIRLLHDGVQEIGSGRLDRRFELKTGDEIEGLADAFNEMAANLQRSFSQLEQRMVEVRRLEEKYRDLIEHSPEMIYQLDRSGRFVHVNKTGLDKLGYQLDDMLKMKLWELVPRGQVSRVLKYLERLVAQGQNTTETVFLAKDGRSIDVEIHATALFDQERGGLVHTRAFVRDVTERHRLEQEVQQYTSKLEEAVSERTQQLVASQARYKALFDLVADSVFMVDPQGQIVAVNKREEQALGYAETSVVGQSLFDVVVATHRHALHAWLDDIRTGQRQVPTQEITVFNAKGQETPVEMDLIRVGGTTQLLVMVQLRDITDRKKWERQLHAYREQLEVKVKERTREIEETKQYLENLLENANDVIYTLDIDQRFTYVNSKVETWGYRKDDLLGRPYLSLLSRRHRGRRLKNTLDIGAKQVYEVEVVTRTGDTRTVMVSVSPLQGMDGEILGVLGIARDMTETKNLEQQIRSSEKLASVGKLAAGVAHEINNPLAGILNCLYNLRKGTLSATRQEEYWTSMEDGVRRVQKIVRQLLDFSQQHEPEFNLTDINEVIDRVLVLTTHLFAPNRIGLVTVPGHALPSLLVDRHMIEQVLMNLILNAVQAMKTGGTLTIRTAVEEGVCRIEVTDTGSGIAPAVLPRIFDPFFTTKGEGEGTGLGLSVSLGIVERHGGKILVASELGRGTTFTLCLPVSRERSLAERLS